MILKAVLRGAGWVVMTTLACALAQSSPEFLPSPVEIVGPAGGDVRSLVLDPADPRVLYAGTADGVIFKSNDGARSWLRLRPGLGRRGLVIDRLIFEPGNSKVLYAATWQLNSGGGGIFRTEDGGGKWQEILVDPASTSVRALGVTPADPQVLYLGTLRGIYRSNDRGRNWTFLRESGHIQHGIESLAVDRRDPSRILAGSRRMAYRSDDGGQGWRAVTKGMKEDSDVFELLQLQGEGDIVLAAACTGIFRSLDGGNTWTHSRLTGVPPGKEMKERTRCLAADPSRPSVVYAGTTVGLYRSIDGGATWEFLYGKELVINAIAPDPSHPDVLYLASDDAGILKSTDGGKTFAKANQGFIHRSITTLLADRHQPRRLILGVMFDGQEGGVFHSVDGGKSWESVSEGLTDGDREILSLYQHPTASVVYFAGTARGLFRSQEEGRRWSAVAPEILRGRVVAIAGAAEEEKSLILAGTAEGLFASRNDGSWAPLLPGDQRFAVSAIAFPGGNPSRFLVASPSQVWITEDGGDTWRISRAGLPSVAMQTFSCPLGWSGPWFAGSRQGIYRSTNQGHYWEKVGRNLGVTDVTGLTAILPPAVTATPFWMLAGCVLTGDFLVSRDGGNAWERLQLPGTGSRVWALLWVDQRDTGPRLLAGTASDGVYSIPFSPVGRRPPLSVEQTGPFTPQ